MPYNTRRKSVSLVSLGVIPQAMPKVSRSLPASNSEQPAAKRVKRVHAEGPSPLRQTAEITPPPSPSASNVDDYTDIDDEIVLTVVRVLERSGNRPHTVRELQHHLSHGVAMVENSANPHAIIASRLNNYLRRKFSPEKPCILERELITTHPRRTYFYLTTSKHQPIPEYEFPAPPHRAIISPAPTDESAEEEEDRRRRIPSPSPELDIFNNYEEVDDDMSETNGSSAIISRDRTSSPSPPLEGDEQEFSDSAISMSMRHRSASQDSKTNVSVPSVVIDEETMEQEHHATFLGPYNLSANALPHPSPLVRPTTPSPVKAVNTPSSKPLGLVFNFGGPDSFPRWTEEIKSPEAVNLHELDDLFEDL